MSRPADFLVEIGTEELPPKALRTLMTAFAEALATSVDEARLEHGDVHGYASPRRLAVLIEQLGRGQADIKESKKGPPVAIAYDDDGELTAAGEAFAKKCGVDASELSRTSTDKGEWLSCDVTEPGQTTADLIPGLVEKAGHRFHSSGSIAIKSPAEYLQKLEESGHVIADFDRRRALVRDGVEAAAKKAGGSVVEGEALYDEVTALVEWPVPITGSFDDGYLSLPREVVISTLTSHQRYFAVADKSGDLLPRFITVANLDSTDPEQVKGGNERVIRPRLADAAFFWEADRRTPLAARQDSLREVVYQRGLGSLFDKAARTAILAAEIAAALVVDPTSVQRAATLAKCDLVTGMVGEFPELQGIMGRYYALADGEPPAVAEAIAEHYLPRFSGDALPASIDGQILAVADKLDTLAGVFVIGKKPSGNRDPFGLRRAALGVIRVLIECDLDLDLKALLDSAIEAQPKAADDGTDLAAELYTFVSERLRRYFLDHDAGLATETFDAVLARNPASLVDFARRLAAVQAFISLEPAASLAAANKRIANILKKAEGEGGDAVKEKLLTDPAEVALAKALAGAREKVAPMLEAREYTDVLTALAELREPVDNFFDDVMVMADDKAIRNNRLSLLSELRALFFDVADISRLSI